MDADRLASLKGKSGKQFLDLPERLSSIKIGDPIIANSEYAKVTGFKDGKLQFKYLSDGSPDELSSFMSVSTANPDLVAKYIPPKSLSKDNYLYHGTSIDRLDKIAKEGLKPGGDEAAKRFGSDLGMFSRDERETLKNSVFLTDSQSYGNEYANIAAEERIGKPLLLRVYKSSINTDLKPDLAAARRWDGQNVSSLSMKGSIPPKDIEIFIKDKWISLLKYLRK